MSELKFSVVILAAGKGTRMKSPLPKVLHPVAGYPMISRVISAVRDAGASEVRAVVGYGENLVRGLLEPMGVTCHKQEKQQGTADAVKSAEPESFEGPVLILNGDHPLLTEKHVEDIMKEHMRNQSDLSVVSVTLDDPKSFGRVVRHKGHLRAIVEAKDASVETLKIKEINTGIYIVDAKLLNECLPEINCSNKQGEYYLTDIISIAHEKNKKLSVIEAAPEVAFGVNNQQELAEATQITFLNKAKELMDEGVIIIDPSSTYIEDSVTVGPGSVIYPGVFLKGDTQIGAYCVLEPNSFVSNSQLKDSIQIKAGSYLDSCGVDNKTVIGPYAHIRPQTQIGKEAKIGNFVELKKVNMGDRSKASHLTYLGDADIGTDCNIGCGVITVNYNFDRKKHKTNIGNNSFVGSDVQLVAPITVGDDTFIACGSTIVKDVPNGALAVTRSKQMVKENYKPRESYAKKNKEEN